MKNRVFYLLIILCLVHSVHAWGKTNNISFKYSSTIPLSLSPGYSRLEDNYDVGFYFIDLEVSDTSTFIKGSVTIKAKRLKERLDVFVLELLGVYQVDSVILQNKRITDFSHVSGLLSVSVPQVNQLDDMFSIRVFYQGRSSVTGYFSGISNGLNVTYNTRVTYTLSEPFQASQWFPSKQNLQDKADSAWIFLTVDPGLMAGSNGLLTNVSVLPDGKKRFEWKTRHPIAYYLLSFSVANYQDYSFYVRTGSDSILVQNYIYNHPDLLKNEKKNIDRTAELITLFSEKFGLYPYHNEKYGHCMAPLSGGMEHQTMTTLNNFRFGLVAHELAHQWFGDYVTCATWQDIWINEGFATYSEYIALEGLGPEEERNSYLELIHSRALNDPEGSIYLTVDESTSEERIFNGALSYNKGASVLHMLRYELNDDDLFFHILKSYLVRFSNSIATGMDFIKVVEEVSGRDFQWFINQWYYGRGYPVFTGIWQQKGNDLIIEAEQFGSSLQTPFFRTHLDIKLVFEDGKDTLLRVLYDEPDESFSFTVKKRVKSVFVDPGDHLLKTAIINRYFPEGRLFTLTPNPFTDSLEIWFRNNTEKEIRITGLNGRIFLITRTNQTYKSINLSYLNSGLYLITVKEGDRAYTEKIVKR